MVGKGIQNSEQYRLRAFDFNKHIVATSGATPHVLCSTNRAFRTSLTQQQLARDPSDILFYIALALLPVDGTLLGIPLPYWTPLSPWFFLAYALANWRYLRLTLRAYLPFFLFPVLLVVTSIYGWQTVAVHANAIALSFVSLLLGLACLASIDIAFTRKHLSARAAITVVVCTYWFAFAVGVAQFIALKLQSDATLHYFAAMMYRRYIRVRPQFLFAEPSYIGMHLFGVLLPLFWLTRDRRLAVLIPVFAAGAIVYRLGHAHHHRFRRGAVSVAAQRSEFPQSQGDLGLRRRFLGHSGRRPARRHHQSTTQ
jgi:hypothetical protein